MPEQTMHMYFTPVIKFPGEPLRPTYDGLQIVLCGTCPEDVTFTPGQPIYACYKLTEEDIAHIAAEIAKHHGRLADPDMSKEIQPYRRRLQEESAKATGAGALGLKVG